MSKKTFNRHSALRFTHFSRKGYALFSVLGKEVLVGVLAVSTLTYAKAEGVSTSTAHALDSLSREEVKLDEVVVTGSRAPLTGLQMAKAVTVVSRQDIDRAAAASINDVLKIIPGVDVRQRGAFGVQTDISVRGGNFDQITILLDGINISSPHTGHLSADFPLSPDDIERIELLEGGYENGLCGTINIITRKAGQKNLGGGVSLAGGSYGFSQTGGNLGFRAGITSHYLSAGYTRSDGATPNSAFSATKAFYSGEAVIRNTTLSATAGYSYKPFEANTFYGAASTDQWESNERWLGAVKARHAFGNASHPWAEIEGGAYYNRWYDHYQWHRDNPAGENFHLADAYGATLNAWFSSPLGKTSIGGELRGEGIWSTSLGILQPEDQWRPTGGHDAQKDKSYRCHDSRTVQKLFVEHNILLNRLTVSPALTYIGVGSTHRLLPAVNIAYRPADSWKVFLSWNMALRMPTFTDLYYKGANIEGNSRLKPELTNDWQVGLRKSGRGYTAEARLSYSHKTDMIDWVTSSPAPGVKGDGVFRSVNFRQNNLGAELNLVVLPQEWAVHSPLRSISVKYAYINEDSEYGVAVEQSKYAMEYLRHKVVLAADGRIWRDLTLDISWRWQERIGNNKPYGLLDARLAWTRPQWELYLKGDNILDKEYYDYISIRQPGITLAAGTRIRF